MTLKNLDTITQNMRLVDTDQVFQLGSKMYMAGFDKSACRLKSDRDRTIFMRGYDLAQEKFVSMTRRWREMDRNTL